MSKNYLHCMADYVAGHSGISCGSFLEFLSLKEADCSAIVLCSVMIFFLVNNVLELYYGY
jgi:hypothetical protein